MTQIKTFSFDLMQNFVLYKKTKWTATSNLVHIRLSTTQIWPHSKKLSVKNIN